MKPVAWAVLLGIAVVLVFLLSIRLGSVPLTTGEVFAALLKALVGNRILVGAKFIFAPRSN